jgi:CheY-like chemotaxis protein
MQLREGEYQTVNIDRRRMIENLLQRGIDNTSMFFEFCRLKKDPPKLLQPVRILEKAVKLVNTISRIHHVDLHRNLSSFPQIYGSYRDLLLLLFYLGENSIDATPEGGLIRFALKVEAKPHQAPDIIFEVTDDGQGFPEDLLKTGNLSQHIRTNSQRIISGAGLFASSEIVADHGGTLELQNRNSGGAQVKIAIPASARDFNELDNLEWEIDAKKMVLTPREDKKYVFLVVDDEESIRTLLLDQLQRRGHVAFCVSSCKEAISEFKELSDIINAVLIDVGLQDCSGYDCVEKLRKIDSKGKMILMSGEESALRRDPSLAVDFLRKPFTVEMVERICRQ